MREFAFSKTDVSEPDHSVRIDLPEGEYMLRAWTDYVDDGRLDDKYYITSDFSAIKVAEPYEGDTDFKDAFVGEAPVEAVRVGGGATKSGATIEMSRPLAKFQFVAEDLYDLVTKAMESHLGKNEYQDYIEGRRPAGGGSVVPSAADYECSIGVSD